MNKAELESKPLSELHSLAAEAGVERYRMLARGELVAKLSGDDSGAQPKSQSRQRSGSGQRSERSGSRERSGSEQRQRPPRQRRRRSGPKADEGGEVPAREREPKPEPAREPEPAPAPAAAAPAESSSRPKRRRRRRFGRRGKQELTLQSLLLPPEAGRQALLAAETREGCTALLRGLASDLAADSKGPDPVVLLIDPSPEELADWKREAPQAEIVAAGQARHASDALAQATARAGKGEDVMLLVDSLTRLGEAYEDASSAKEFFDAGRAQGSSTGGGTLTVVAALERS
jgi:transcription termination factor Rho